jgi:hypothetical protein
VIDYKQSPQAFFLELGEAACYALCVGKLAADILKITPSIGWYADAIMRGVDAKVVSLGQPPDPDNMTVLNAGVFLSLLTGQKWTHSKAPATYKVTYPEMTRVVDCMARGSIRHFVIPLLPPHQTYFDPLGESRTAKEGFIESKRVFVRS